MSLNAPICLQAQVRWIKSAVYEYKVYRSLSQIAMSDSIKQTVSLVTKISIMRIIK